MLLIVKKLDVWQQFQFDSGLRTKIINLSGTTLNWILLDVNVAEVPMVKLPSLLIAFVSLPGIIPKFAVLKMGNW